ncbi:DMT family transporter [Desulfuromonas sp. AOP6]|uniref:DMT family transporter n=1 Tax=Desulfuromonas sp. AOP6 TaxID=1566351 RepID=UPI00126C0535|nr:DMT family transporter [Desulfuromonas sp. AOP6]BCA78723.1 transporter [Desulfuromonas sp. AOP6]
MKSAAIKSDVLLLLTATIWGFAFVAQRLGMDHVGPFTFNGVRFALGSLSLVPLWLLSRRRVNRALVASTDRAGKVLLWGGIAAGLALFTGASLQQVGLVYTTAGKAGFITGLYVILVPILGLIWRQRPQAGTWAGATLAVFGLYLLCVTEEFTIAFGDLLELLGAFFWAGHVLLIGWLSPRVDAIRLSCIQFAVCSLLSLATAVVLEVISLQGLLSAALPILYGGLMSVGVAYTLQVIAQREAHPAHTAIILSLEGAFAALGGWLILGETLSARGLLGCLFMLAGMLFSELSGFFVRRRQIAGAV